MSFDEFARRVVFPVGMTGEVDSLFRIREGRSGAQQGCCRSRSRLDRLLGKAFES